VFEGDELFSDLSSQKDRHLIAERLSGNRIMMTDGGIFCLSDLSWNPPKRNTSHLNGEELPIPFYVGKELPIGAFIEFTYGEHAF